MNIENLEEDFLPSQKVTHVYGAVNLQKTMEDSTMGGDKRVIGP